jgi:hypothetical protein
MIRNWIRLVREEAVLMVRRYETQHLIGGIILGPGAESPALPDSGVPSDGVRESMRGGGVNDAVQPNMLVEVGA